MTTLFRFHLPLGSPGALAALLLGLTPAAYAQAGFAAVANYAVSGTAPIGVAVADLNGDGRPDVVTANQDSNNVSVLLGQASPAGTLGVAATYAMSTNSRPTGIAVADVNGDGRPDLVVANQVAGTVGVLLNSATAPGTFSSPTAYDAGGNTNMLRLADLNGDGRPDIVTSNLNTSRVGVLLASATVAGTFTPVTLYNVVYPLGLAVADINRDGRPDLMVTTYSSLGGSVSVLLNSATEPGTFNTSSGCVSGGLQTADVGLADLNGDGYLDAALSNFGSNSVSVLLGTATSLCSTAAVYPLIGAPNLLALADVNGDARPDLVVGNRTTNTVSVLTGQVTPAGTFAPAITYSTGAGSLPVGVVVADLNGDTRPDIVVTNVGTNSVGVLLNTTPLATAPTLAGTDVSLYPNPARGTFTVQLPARTASATVQAELLDVLGRVVRRATLRPTPDARLTVEATGLPAGHYALHLQAATWQLTRGVVLE